MAVEPDQRAVALANAHADLYEYLEQHGLADRVAFVELHNEVQAGYLTEGLPGENHVLELSERLTNGLNAFHQRLPQLPVTVNYARVPIEALRGVPENIDVAVFHPYIYGVLDDLVVDFALRDEANFSTERVRPLLREGAPDYATWLPPEATCGAGRRPSSANPRSTSMIGAMRRPGTGSATNATPRTIGR